MCSCPIHGETSLKIMQLINSPSKILRCFKLESHQNNLFMRSFLLHFDPVLSPVRNPVPRDWSRCDLRKHGIFLRFSASIQWRTAATWWRGVYTVYDMVAWLWRRRIRMHHEKWNANRENNSVNMLPHILRTVKK